MNGILCAVVGFVIALLATPSPALANDKLAFWDAGQRKGANFFNTGPIVEPLDSGRELGLEFIRLVPDKWTPAGGKDFLIGDADAFTAIDEADFATLKQALDDAHARGHKVVLGMLSLPGARWVQLNSDAEDGRLWADERYHAQAAAFWRELASRLKDHPAIVAYNPLNEPHPEKFHDIDGSTDEDFPAWLEEHRGMPADLDRFYKTIVSAIREADPHTPILVEGYGHGDAKGLTFLTPINDPAILYSFHFYEPWQYTARRANKGRYVYPDKMPRTWNGPGEPWTGADLAARMQPVADWAKRHGIPASRIVAAEFGVDRRTEGAPAYLRDVISTLNEHGWHWAFYAYREDAWDGMDYEYGTQQPPKQRGENDVWEVIRKEF